MANLKYGEETKVISLRVPVSRIAEVKKLVKEFLSSEQDAGLKNEAVKLAEVNKSKCDCYLDDLGLLRRGKTKCSKSKSEHKFQ